MVYVTFAAHIINSLPLRLNFIGSFMAQKDQKSFRKEESYLNRIRLLLFQLSILVWFVSLLGQAESDIK
jgi:hypothetical protein